MSYSEGMYVRMHMTSLSNSLPPTLLSSHMVGFLRVRSRLEEGAMPMDPLDAAARCNKMSACKFVATIVSSDTPALA